MKRWVHNLQLKTHHIYNTNEKIEIYVSVEIHPNHAKLTCIPFDKEAVLGSFLFKFLPDSDVFLCPQNYGPKQPKSLDGALPVARYLAAISSALRMSSLFLASTMAFLSSASLWIMAILFFIFSAYSAFFFSKSSCKRQKKFITCLHRATVRYLCGYSVYPTPTLI